jgi:hypothetical protein
MKRLTPVLFLAALCVGCGQQEKKDPIKKAPKPVHATHAAPQFHYGNPVLLQYDQYLANLDTQLVNMGSKAVDTFQVLFKNQPPAVCDTAFYLFNQFHKSLCTYLNLHTEADSIKYENFLFDDENGKKPVLSKKQKAIKQGLDKNGFGLDSEEGIVFLVQDQQYLMLRFNKYLSTSMKQYLAQVHKEQKEGFQDDAGLSISAIQLADLTVWWEKFLKDNPNFMYATDAANNYQVTLYFLMEGMENTRVNDYYNDSIPNGYILSDYFQTAWTYVQQKHPQSQTNAIVTPYLNAWLKKDSAEISQVINNFEKEHKLPWQ